MFWGNSSSWRQEGLSALVCSPPLYFTLFYSPAVLGFTKTCHSPSGHSSFVRLFKLKAPSVSRVLCQYVERVWKFSSVGRNHLERVRGDHRYKNKGFPLKGLTYQQKPIFSQINTQALGFKVNITGNWFVNKCFGTEQLIFSPFMERVEVTETDVPSVTFTSDQRKSEQLLLLRGGCCRGAHITL